MDKEVEFKGYWSTGDKAIWHTTDWEARDYKELPVEDDTFFDAGYFYSMDDRVIRQVEFVKYIRANPIYPPYYGPKKNADLLNYVHEGHYVGPMFDGRTKDEYNIHDRFESQELYNKLSI